MNLFTQHIYQAPIMCLNTRETQMAQFSPSWSLLELLVEQVKLTSDNHMNKCRITTVVKVKDGGLHCKMRAWKREL